MTSTSILTPEFINLAFNENKERFPRIRCVVTKQSKSKLIISIYFNNDERVKKNPKITIKSTDNVSVFLEFLGKCSDQLVENRNKENIPVVSFIKILKRSSVDDVAESIEERLKRGERTTLRWALGNILDNSPSMQAIHANTLLIGEKILVNENFKCGGLFWLNKRMNEVELVLSLIVDEDNPAMSFTFQFVNVQKTLLSKMNEIDNIDDAVKFEAKNRFSSAHKCIALANEIVRLKRGISFPYSSYDLLTSKSMKSIDSLINNLVAIKTQIKTYIDMLSTGVDLRARFGEHWLIEQYSDKRSEAREVIIYAGPTNSGKTYNSIGNITGKGNNAYMAPLRLLAMEISDKLNEQGIPCNLITGEEREVIDGAYVTSSTIEMANLSAQYDCVIIDEAQMIDDECRGAAWTRAILGINTKKLVLCCSPNAVEALKALLAIAGDNDIKVVELERMTSLECQQDPTSLDEIKPGTAIIAFSKKQVLSIKSFLQSEGRTVSTIYGALPPEVRRKQADDFASGKTEIVVATDAIGMGMNLPIEHVVFTAQEKFDGSDFGDVTESLVKQIAGRAGRYLKYEKGFYTGISKSLVSFCEGNVNAPPKKIPSQFHLSPSNDVIVTLSETLDTQNMREIIGTFIKWVSTDPRFKADKWQSALDVYSRVAEQIKTIDMPQQVEMLLSPCNINDEVHLNLVNKGIIAIKYNNKIDVPKFGKLNMLSLDSLEKAVSAVALYRYLHFKFPNVFHDIMLAKTIILELNKHIEKKLSMIILKKCSSCYEVMPPLNNLLKCEACFSNVSKIKE